jgi:DASS family divalent anion:Na+ symporter
MFFSQGYVSMKKWWQVGLCVSIVNLVVWTVAGFSWWKFLKIW